ncbi:hypothetical protein FM119_11525 [Mycetocola reblochoni REB411]|uniref:Uncharacterized protein n=1 Tax=Mycetocola reblochoni REB411 TaxID=1255698 RepID=A0A1R4K577_9MICO|nr:hypothetical protein FM119_11525 [Mycetocola reblochoni REB411]
MGGRRRGPRGDRRGLPQEYRRARRGVEPGLNLASQTAALSRHCPGPGHNGDVRRGRPDRSGRPRDHPDGEP